MPFHVVTGIGTDGRSTVISREERLLGAASEAGMPADDAPLRAVEYSSPVTIRQLFEAETTPLVERPARGTVLPVKSPPGGLLWIDMKFDGMSNQKLHRTDTIDLHYVTGGEVEIVLENGSAVLKPGDTLIVPGVLHGWRSANGWSATVFAVGIDPASGYASG